MSSEEIIEFKGRKFQRLGIMEFPQCGQWYLLGRLPIVATRNHADFETKIKRELLRELPAETPAATDDLRNIVGQFMLVRGIRMGDMIEAGRVQDLIEEWAGREQCSLLVEAEEVLARLIEDLPVKRDWFDPALESRAKAVLARIRAAKEKS